MLVIAAAVNERLPRFAALGERSDGRLGEMRVGEFGSELFARGDFGNGEDPSPAAASVRRNSTHRRENDCMP